MSFLFGGGPERGTQPRGRADIMNDQRVKLRTAVRRLTREESKSVKEEQQLITDIKRHAHVQDMAQCTMKARELVRVRAHTRRIRVTQSQMNAISRQLGTLTHTATTGESMVQLTRFLQVMNRDMDLKGMHRMCNEFERQQSNMGDTVTAMDEKMDEMFEEDNENGCTDDVLAGVFAELGIDTQAKMQKVPSNGVPVPAAEGPEPDLEERLRRLRA